MQTVRQRQPGGIVFALARNEGRPAWIDVPQSDIGPDDVLIRVSLVGLCRTDFAVARGEIAVEEPRILGHEFSGEVVAVGENVGRVVVGDLVGANPVVSCGICDRCVGGLHLACGDLQFLGIDRDGAIAETIVIPARNAWKMPAGTDARMVAMLEPVAACAAVTRAPILPQHSGVILGTGRLAKLTAIILQQYGFTRIDCVEPPLDESSDNSRDQYDFAIDTVGSPSALQWLFGALRPRGILVLKSRPTQPIPVNLRSLMPKEPSLHVVNYAPFAEARRLLVDCRIDLSELLGPIWPADDFHDAMEIAADDPHRKHFIAAPVQKTNRAIKSGSEPTGVWDRRVFQ